MEIMAGGIIIALAIVALMWRASKRMDTQWSEKDRKKKKLIKVQYFKVEWNVNEANQEINNWLAQHKRDFVDQPEIIYTPAASHPGAWILAAVHYHVMDPEAEGA